MFTVHCSSGKVSTSAHRIFALIIIIVFPSHIKKLYSVYLRKFGFEADLRVFAGVVRMIFIVLRYNEGKLMLFVNGMEMRMVGKVGNIIYRRI